MATRFSDRLRRLGRFASRSALERKGPGTISRRRRLACEPLEERRLLALLVGGTPNDLVLDFIGGDPNIQFTALDANNSRVTGNTFEHRDKLKELGYRYSHNKKCWYWRPYTERSRASKPTTMDYIREKYGSDMEKEAS